MSMSTYTARRDRITKATAKVRRWRIIADCVYLALWVAPLTMALTMRFMDIGTKSQRWGSWLTLWVVLVVAYCIAGRRKEAALDAHPLAFLVRLQDAFGTAKGTP